jgi:hypothetical protein
MTTYTHKKQAVLDRIERKNITDYIRQGIFELRRQGYYFNLNNPQEAVRLKELLDNPLNTSFKSGRDPMDGFYYWHDQKVDFVRSNLGHDRGVLFYFICNSCKHRVKYLYEYSSCYSPICRTCCRLGYKYPVKKLRNLSRLLGKSYLSREEKRAIIRYAGITKEDML